MEENMKDYLTPEWMDAVLTVVILPLLGLVTKYVIVLLKRKITQLEQAIGNDLAQNYLNLAENAIESAVISVNQTFVEALKKSGAFDEAAMIQSFRMAKELAIGIIGEAAREGLKLAYNDVDAWLESKIEYYVNKIK
jgi:hypothetical protein